MTRVVAFGDIMGRVGRRTLRAALEKIQSEFEPDLLIANGENSAGGFGITKKVFLEFVEKLGIHCITTGNHWSDKREVYDFIDTYDNLLAPANMMNVSKLESGFWVGAIRPGLEVAVINLIGKVFMHPDNRCPFEAIDKILQDLPSSVRIRIVDVHAEATSEKQGLGHYLSGKVSLVYGTHSHVPTADERIIDGKTGFATDIGMTGAYDSVIGMDKNIALQRLRDLGKAKFQPAKGDPWACFIVADISDETGYCHDIQRYRWSLKT